MSSPLPAKVSGVLPTADPYLPGHGDPGWSAQHYDLEIEYDVAANRLAGDATISALALTELSRVVLDLARLQVKKVLVDGRAPARHAHREHRLVIDLREPVPAGETFELRVRYSGVPKPLVLRHHGDAGWEELADGVIVAGQPHGAPTWFPCNDRADDKATYAIAVTANANYTVVANGRLDGHTRRGSGERWAYVMEAPMAPYLATVQIGRYTLVDLPPTDACPVPMRAALPADARAGFERSFGRQPEMMAYFGSVFGAYPFEGYTVVVTDDDLEIPLESQSLSTFGRNFLTGEWSEVRLVAHELAHQWFGNAVTARRLQDIWLHEGFACYAEWLWSEAGGYGTCDAQARHHHKRLAALPQDLLLGDPGPELVFDDRVYKRGALTLHALRGRLGDELFFDLLRSWVEQHSGAAVTSADFESLAEQVADEPLGDLFDAWLRRTALPRL
jgi:aminopeptidase N